MISNCRSVVFGFAAAAFAFPLLVIGPSVGAGQERADKPPPRTMRVSVLDADEKPLAGVLIHAGVWTKDPFKANRDYKTDAEGRATVELPQSIDILRLWATKDGHVGLFAQWWPAMQPDGHLIPNEYAFGLARGTVIGGVVKNDAGEPIRGAKVQASCASGPM